MHRSFYDRTRREVRDLSSGPFRILLDIEVRRVQRTSVCWVTWGGGGTRDLLRGTGALVSP